MPIKDRIRELRDAKGWSQGDLAERLQPYLLGEKWDRFKVSKVERGERAVKADELRAWANALGCTIDDLLDPIS